VRHLRQRDPVPPRPLESHGRVGETGGRPSGPLPHGRYRLVRRPPCEANPPARPPSLAWLNAACQLSSCPPPPQLLHTALTSACRNAPGNGRGRLRARRVPSCRRTRRAGPATCPRPPSRPTRRPAQRTSLGPVRLANAPPRIALRSSRRRASLSTLRSTQLWTRRAPASGQTSFSIYFILLAACLRPSPCSGLSLLRLAVAAGSARERNGAV